MVLFKIFKARLGAFLGIGLAVLSLTSCVYLVAGGIGALGGYVVSPDTVEGVTDHDYLTVWDAAVEIAGIMGTIREKYESSGIVVAKISGSKVTVTVTQMGENTVKLSVKSRKWFFPRINTSQDVFVKTMTYLTGSL